MHQYEVHILISKHNKVFTYERHGFVNDNTSAAMLQPEPVTSLVGPVLENLMTSQVGPDWPVSTA